MTVRPVLRLPPASLAFVNASDPPPPGPLQGRMKAGSAAPALSPSERSVPLHQIEHERDHADQNEAERPDRIQIEPAARNKFQAEIAVSQPREGSADSNHGG